MLNAKGITWGWFQGGFAPTGTTASGAPVCGASHTNIGGVSVADYSPHHNPFEYYASTANPNHTPPASLAEVGPRRPGQPRVRPELVLQGASDQREPAGGELPQGRRVPGRARGLLRPDRRAELPGQHDQRDRAVQVLAQHRDHDHLRRLGRLVRPRHAADHQLLRRPGARRAERPRGLRARPPLGGIQDRCGYGQRLPFLVISPYARTNYVSSTIADQTSILAFIEDNWLGGQRIAGTSFDNLAGSLNDMFSWDHPSFAPYLLDPATGEPGH